MKEQNPEDQVQETVDASAENTEKTAETSVSDPLEDLKKQLEESRNKFLYLFSDFENYKRHAAKERMDLITTAGREILTALLPVLDDFDRAQKNGGLSDGMALIHHKLVHTLKTKGLSQFETQAGDPFDADRHEAIAEIPAPTDELKGKIVDVVEHGYNLGDRIIRFAKVVVGK
ncbi:MAG: nucleotide exchange factor GrpE [Saprospiraceae bacterium]|nr:nucleotide exchange factor GrpE [Saprospiraceae bacterium]